MIQTTAKNKVIIGSRESRLAVLQSKMVRDYIKQLETKSLTGHLTKLAEKAFL